MILINFFLKLHVKKYSIGYYMYNTVIVSYK